MAEVPQHLLEKAKARRAALAGAPVEETSPAIPAAASVAAVGASSPALASSGGGSTPPPPSAPASVPTAPPPPRGTGFAKMGSVFLLVAIPLWAVFMFNSFATPFSKTLTPEKQGETLFANNCASCHLGNGSGWDNGGIGRALWNGEAEKTFPNPLDQLAFVKHGSCGSGAGYGNPKREGGQHIAQQKGIMPAFTGVLTDTEILYVVQYERSILRSKDAGWPEDLLASVGEKPNPDRIPAAGQALDLKTVLAKVDGALDATGTIATTAVCPK